MAKTKQSTSRKVTVADVKRVQTKRRTQRTEATYDNINPPHYKAGVIETIDFMEQEFPQDPHLFTACKYLARAGKKPSSSYNEDCQKAIWYIQRAMEFHGGAKKS